MPSAGRAVSVLRLFTLEEPSWTVDEAAARLSVSIASAYRYFAVLVEAGLLTGAANARYVLGPSIIQFDRQIQLADPLLTVARPIMAEAIRAAPHRSVALLCRVYRDVVLCVHQAVNTQDQAGVGYERGKPMPLFAGATSKIILAHLPARELRSLHQRNAETIDAAKLGANWLEFKSALAALRKAGFAVSRMEVDANRIGVAAPVFGERRVVGSLSFVIPAADESCVPQMTISVVAAAREIERNLQSVTPAWSVKSLERNGNSI